MDCLLSITTAAFDKTLLTVAERRAAVGLSDASKDAELAALEARVAAAITKACRVQPAGSTPPTLRLETISVTFRPEATRRYLIMPRRPIVSITSITENGTALAASGYEIESASGLIRRLSGDNLSSWPSGKIVVAGTAGWSTVPDDLKLAAVKFMQAEWQQGSRDPLLKRVSIDGVSEREWWVDPSKDSVVPAEVMDLLQRGGFVETWV